MLDLKFIRENTDKVQQAMDNRQDSAPLDKILQLDSERRQKINDLESFRRERKEAARERKTDKDEGRGLRVKIKGLEEEVRHLDEQLEEFLLQVPNIPNPRVPFGKD